MRNFGCKTKRNGDRPPFSILVRFAQTTEAPRIVAARRAPRGPSGGTRASRKPRWAIASWHANSTDGLARRLPRPPGTSCPRRHLRGDTEGASARHGSGPRKNQLRGIGRNDATGWTDTDGQSPFLHDAPDDDFRVLFAPFEDSRLQANESISCDPRRIHVTPIRSSARCSVSAGAASASAGGRTATEWLATGCGAAHERARADVARPVATRAMRGRPLTGRFRGVEWGQPPKSGRKTRDRLARKFRGFLYHARQGDFVRQSRRFHGLKGGSI